MHVGYIVKHGFLFFDILCVNGNPKRERSPMIKAAMVSMLILPQHHVISVLSTEVDRAFFFCELVAFFGLERITTFSVVKIVII